MELRVLVLSVVVSASATVITVGPNANHLTQRVAQLQKISLSKRSARTMCSSGNCSRTTLEVGGSTIDVEFRPGRLDLPMTRLNAWVVAAARAVSCYYGRFPVNEAQILIVPVEGRHGVLSGTSWGTRPTSTRIYVGESTNETELENDWIMTHEMVHYAFPSMTQEHHWIEEGIATYVEPLARLETGEIRAVKVWGDLIDGLPYGLPASGDAGLDHTHTWGRTYWGGAMFCLLADVRIRRQTKDRYGLRDALRAIVRAGGNMETTWPLTRALEVGDRAVGVPVLMQLYQQMRVTPVKPDLPQLWSRLGIAISRKSIIFDDAAPWASTRRAIAADKSNLTGR